LQEKDVVAGVNGRTVKIDTWEIYPVEKGGQGLAGRDATCSQDGLWHRAAVSCQCGSYRDGRREESIPAGIGVG